MRLANTNLQIEENDERLKIVLPLKRQWPGLLAYSLLSLIWLGMLALFVVYLFNPPLGDFVSIAYRVGWRLLILVWLVVWGRYLGRYVLRGWQFYAASREILFINRQLLIIRRPVSLFGLTDAYDMQYVSPFYRHERSGNLAFQYGKTNHILFGLGLSPVEQGVLLSYLNHRFFPQSVANEAAG
jgi:hypothetical protein